MQELAAVPLERLEEIFGRWGTALYRKARGDDTYEFFIDAEPKSISHNCTFREDTADREAIESTLSLLAQKAGKRLRDAGLFCRTVTLTLRFANFHTITRSRTSDCAVPIWTALFFAHARELLRGAWNGSAKLRLVGVALSSFLAASAATGQLELLDSGHREKLERLAQAGRSGARPFGFSKLQLGGSLRSPRDH